MNRGSKCGSVPFYYKYWNYFKFWMVNVQYNIWWTISNENIQNNFDILRSGYFISIIATRVFKNKITIISYSLNLNQPNFHWSNQWKKYFSLSNQSIFTEIISEIWLIYSNLFLAIWISQISLIISRFWLI